MLERPYDPWRITNFEAIVKWAFELLRESTGSRDDGRLFGLLKGTQSDRELAALLLGLREDPVQLPTLAALAFDPSPIVRSGAAEALGLWAAQEVGGNPVHELLNDLLQDPGSRVAREVASGLSGATSRAAIAPHEQALLTHISAQVRHRTRQLIDKIGCAA
jgi:HEAT repeat protein